LIAIDYLNLITFIYSIGKNKRGRKAPSCRRARAARPLS